jgi:hypothetical protein
LTLNNQCWELAEQSFTLGIIAEPEEFQPDQDKGSLNMLVLLELLDRSVQGEDLFYEMEDYILFQRYMMPSFQEYQRTHA